MTRILFALLAALVAGPAVAADLANVVCSAPLPAGDVKAYNVVELPDGRTAAAQVTAAPLLAEARERTLVFILPTAEAGAATAVKPGVITHVKAPPAFRFVEKKGEHVDLVFDGRKVLRYMNAPRDGSSKDAHELTFKPFHHVFDPATGETLLTNGAGLAADKSLTFPHHRGLFYAFNKISYGDQKDVDTWHGRRGEYTLHKAMLAEEAGPVLGRHTAALAWHGRDGKPFADEKRELTAYNVPGGTLIDFASVLTTTLPKVRLDGDPQHAGFHFRAAMEVAKTGKQNTYYLRPDGKGKVGETRNWDPKTKQGPVNLPWDAMSFVVGGKRYTVLRMNHPDNLGEARGSERDYGRFGDYFEYDLTPEKPLRVKYRVWVQEGEMTVEQCAAMHKGFADPPKVELK
jgi:hypothetical protein